MPSQGEALRFGPFVGGLNTASDPTSVADSELVEMNNFNLEIDGSLASRSPILQVDPGAGNSTHLRAIGTGIFNNVGYVIFGSESQVFSWNGTTFALIGNIISHKAVQYAGMMWILPAPGSADTGVKWDPVGGAVNVAALPEGESAVIHKERLFVVPGDSATTDSSRIKFSEPADFETFQASNFIDVSKGDGQNLIDVIVFNDNLLLFKHDSTYVLAYDLQPSDAILREVNSVIGVTRKNCVIQYENSVFTFHEGNVYEIINYDFNRINIKVPFIFDGGVPTGATRVEEVFLSLVGDNLVVRYFNRIYVFGLKTRTWSTWSSANSAIHNFGKFIAFPQNVVNTTNRKYVAGSSLEDSIGNQPDSIGDREVYIIQDGYDATTKEALFDGQEFTITCTMRTKNFDIADSHHFKRLYWWGADVLTTNSVLGSITPIISGTNTTWGSLSNKTWGSLATWGLPTVDNSVETNVTQNSSVKRIFTKFLKSLRFRQMNYKVVLTTDGTLGTGPCKVFTITGIIRTKQIVSKGVN